MTVKDGELFDTDTDQDVLPKSIEPYEAPDKVLKDAGLAFDFCIKHCYPNKFTGSVPKFFGVSRQTFWVWRQPRHGVPNERSDDLARLVADVGERFTLPTNLKVEDLLNNSVKKTKGVASRQNDAFLLVLTQIVSGNYPPMARATLDRMIEGHMHNIRSPHVFWQWAYCYGGIPTTYVPAFVKAMIREGVPDMLKMSPTKFRKYAITKLVAHPHLFEENR